MAENEPKPPESAFTVRISIHGETWDYVRDALQALAERATDRTGLEFGLVSGGGGGSHSADVQTRDVTVKQYRSELEAWRQAKVRRRQEEVSGG